MDKSIIEIVHRMDNLSNFDKDAISKLFENLMKKQEDRFDELIANNDRLMKLTEDSSINWDIITALIDKDKVGEAKNNGLYEVCCVNSFREKLFYDDLKKVDTDNSYDADKRYFAGIGFLDCKYPDVCMYTNKNYKASVSDNSGQYEVNYTLIPDRQFLVNEKIIEYTAIQYGIKTPYIFSPMSRRAVQVIVNFSDKTISRNDDLKIDFMLNENGLSDIMLCGKTLVWNIQITNKSLCCSPKENTDKRIAEEFAPLFNDVYRIYKFPAEKNEYYYIKSKVHDVKRFGSEIYFSCFETETNADISFCKIELYKYVDSYCESNRYKFRNFFLNNSLVVRRIRTKADVDCVMTKFNNNIAQYVGISKELKSDNCEHKSIYVYDSRNTYNYKTEDMSILSSNSLLYVLFKRSDSIFFEDYISYIMSYLKNNYPEFNWVGAA